MRNIELQLFCAGARSAFLILTGYSTCRCVLPVGSGFGMTLFGIGLLFMCWLFILHSAVCQASLPCLDHFALFSGAQLFTLGIFGEYLARMFDRSMDRPPYVVDEIRG
jgi:hypothetical protein